MSESREMSLLSENIALRCCAATVRAAPVVIPEYVIEGLGVKAGLTFTLCGSHFVQYDESTLTTNPRLMNGKCVRSPDTTQGRATQ